MLIVNINERWLAAQVTPTWIDIDKDGNSILVNTAEGRIKHKNVSRDQRVAISISDQNKSYNMVSIRGRVIEQISEDDDEHTDRALERSTWIWIISLSFTKRKRGYPKDKARKSILSTTT